MINLHNDFDVTNCTQAKHPSHLIYIYTRFSNLAVHSSSNIHTNIFLLLRYHYDFDDLSLPVMVDRSLVPLFSLSTFFLNAPEQNGLLDSLLLFSCAQIFLLLLWVLHGHAFSTSRIFVGLLSGRPLHTQKLKDFIRYFML